MKEERKKYEIPSMERNLVELEDGFCAASVDVQNPDANNGRINYQEVNDEFSNEADFSTGSWD